MAGIKSDIILNDKMSPVLRDMNKQLKNVTQALEDMEKTGGDAFDDSEMRDFKQALSQTSENLKKLEKNLENAGESAEQSEGKFGKLKGVLKGVGKAAAAVGSAAIAGATALGVGVAKLTKSAVESYGNYEQLVGGVETLFGAGGLTLKQYAKQEGKSVADVESEYNTLTAAQNTVLKNANNAYKTAGLSANEYMETATGFAASLVSSLGGDTTKAAAYADMAVIDMADNANKMGTDIASIQNAYQGFAKQNYTMLDNLKLGYGGTKEEMQRLLKKAQEISGQKYDISSFADITEAIHVIQKDMGILGTTKREAEGTIQGSMNMMKASWQNMLTALVTGGDQYDQCVDNLVSSVSAFVKNIMPAIQGALNGVSALIDDLAPIIAKKLPKMLKNFLPGLISAITNIFGSIGNALPELLNTILSQLPKIIPVFVQVVLSLVDAIVENLPLFLKAILQLVTTLTKGLAKASPKLIPVIVQMIIEMANSLIRNVNLLLPATLQLIRGLANGLLTALPTLIAALPTIINSIVIFLLTSLPLIIQTGITLLTALVDALPTIISAISAALPQIITGIVIALLNNLDSIINAGITLLTAIIDALPVIIDTILIGVYQIVDDMKNGFLEKVDDMKEAGKNLLKGLWNGISDTVGWVIERVKGVGTRILESIRGIFREGSPSKETEQSGIYLMQGLGNGVTETASYAVKATKNAAKDVLNAASGLSANAQIGATFTGVTGSMSELEGGTYDIMRNYAAQDSVNKFTTAQVNINMGGVTNQIASGNDVDDLITQFVDGVQEALSTASQGVHKR